MYLHWNATSLNVNSFAFHMIKTLLQIVEAFQEPYYSHDTSLISIMYAKPDTFDSEDYVARSILNLQRMHVLQYSRCPHSIKHLTKQNKNKQTNKQKSIKHLLFGRIENIYLNASNFPLSTSGSGPTIYPVPFTPTTPS